MTDDERYLFDLTGYLVIENALSPEEVAQCNAAIEHHADKITERPKKLWLAGDSKTLAGTSSRLELGSMLGWERPWCEPFRKMLCHPRVKPYLDTILGEGYRLDHGPGMIGSKTDAEGHWLHHGGAEVDAVWGTFMYRNDRFICGLTTIEYLLADEGPGDGGFAIVAGSHKANLPSPRSLKGWESYQEHVSEVNGKAGDAIIFSETCTHGALPWTAEHDRRAILYKFSPAYLAFANGHHRTTPPDYAADMSEEERAVLEPPHTRG